MNKNFLSFLTAFFFVLFLIPFSGIWKTFYSLQPSVSQMIWAVFQYICLSIALVTVVFWFSRAKSWGHILFWSGVHAWMIAWAVRAFAQSDRWIMLIHQKSPLLFLFCITIFGFIFLDRKLRAL